MAKLEGLAHIGLFVKDLEVTKKFYTEMLDFEIINECTLPDPKGTTKIAFMKSGGLVVEGVQFPEHQKRTDGVFDHLAIAVEDIEAVRAMLEKRGIVFEEKDITHAPNVMHNGAKWILFRGPDGEHLEITELL